MEGTGISLNFFASLIISGSPDLGRSLVMVLEELLNCFIHLRHYIKDPLYYDYQLHCQCFHSSVTTKANLQLI